MAAPAVPVPAAPSPARPVIGEFTDLEPGLSLGVFPSPSPSGISDELIYVLRADPSQFKLALGLASETGSLYTAPEWMQQRPDWVAVINAAMFEQDYLSSTFFMQHGEHVNQHKFSKKASNVLVFDPIGEEPQTILDVNCDPWPVERKKYTSFVQSFRLLDCAGRPTWRENGRIWSHALIGTDREGRLLFIHARSPWSTYEFTKILQELPIQLRRLQYAEGGPEASLVVRSGGLELQRMGSYETGFNENDDANRFYRLPLVLGLVRKGVKR